MRVALAAPRLGKVQTKRAHVLMLHRIEGSAKTTSYSRLPANYQKSNPYLDRALAAGNNSYSHQPSFCTPSDTPTQTAPRCPAHDHGRRRNRRRVVHHRRCSRPALYHPGSCPIDSCRRWSALLGRRFARCGASSPSRRQRDPICHQSHG